MMGSEPAEEQYETTVYDKRTDQPVSGCVGNAIAQRNEAREEVERLEQRQRDSNRGSIRNLQVVLGERDQAIAERDEALRSEVKAHAEAERLREALRELEANLSGAGFLSYVETPANEVVEKLYELRDVARYALDLEEEKP